MEGLMSGVAIGILSILAVLYWYFKAPNRFFEKLNLQCFGPTSRFDSIVSPFKGKSHLNQLEGMKKYGYVFGMFDFGNPNVVVCDPVLIKNVLVKDFSLLRNPQDVSDFISEHEMLSHMLFALRDDKWKRVRTIISPVFTTGKIKRTFPHLYDCTKTLLKNFTTSSDKKEIVQVKKFYEALGIDIIANVAFGTKIDSHNDPQNPFVVNGRRILNSSISWRLLVTVFIPPLAKYLGLSVTDPVSEKFFRGVVNQIIEARKKTNQKHNDFIELMMEASEEAGGNKGLTNDEFMANSIMFFFVALGTTSLTMSFISYLLAMHPECQERLIKEIDDTLQDHDFDLSYETIQGMKYLDMVVSETLRLYPIAFRTEREVDSEYVLETTGTKLKKGTIITIPIYAVQRNPDIYPDPDKFDPERFSPEEKAKRDPYAYIPFSAGPRNCVGSRFALFNIKTCLLYTMSQFRFKKCPKTSVPLVVKSGFQAPLLEPEEISLYVEERTDKVLEGMN